MVQKERKSGHWQVERLQFLKREQRGLRLHDAVIELQPCYLQTAIFSSLLQHKECPNFSNQTTTFLEKRPDLSLPNEDEIDHKQVLLRYAELVNAQGVIQVIFEYVQVIFLSRFQE